MTGWVVSMHGAVNSYASVAKGTTIYNLGVGDEPFKVKIPEGRKIHFYVKEFTALNGGWDLFGMLMNPGQIGEARNRATETLEAGAMCCNYFLFPEPAWRDAHGSASGVFVAGDRDNAQTWLLDQPGQSLSLRQLLDYTSSGDEIFWISCRSLR